MKESDLRKWHRTIGIVLAVFVALQAGSGFLLSLNELSMPHSHAYIESVVPHHGHEEGESIWHEGLEFVHHGGGLVGTAYRLLVGIGIIGMAISGCMIFFKIRARSRSV